MKTITKDFSYRGQHFAIVYDGKFYMTVNHKYIDGNGCLTKELHFNDLHTSNTMEQLITYTKNALDMDYYEAQGMTKAEAFAKVMNVPLEIAQMIF